MPELFLRCHDIQHNDTLHMVFGVTEQNALKNMSSYGNTIDIKRRKNRLLKFCYVPATSAAHNRPLFFLFFAAGVYSPNEANKAGSTRC